MISRHLVALSGAGVDEVVVVTGHAREAVEEQVRSFPVSLAHNDAHAEGQDSSVRVGLAALSGPFDAVFIVLADQPLIGARRPDGADRRVQEAPRRSRRGAGGGRTARQPDPARRGRARRILESGVSLGCRHLLERNPELVHVHATGNTRFVTDLDTVEDVERLARSTGWRLEMPVLETAQ